MALAGFGLAGYWARHGLGTERHGGERKPDSRDFEISRHRVYESLTPRWNPQRMISAEDSLAWYFQPFRP
jgi:hypothetical protein